MDSLPDNLSYTRTLIANVIFCGEPGSNEWTLVDAGLSGFAEKIANFAAGQFAPGRPPRSVVLTHGHFDHVGSLAGLLDRWPDTQVYAHSLELPYLTGKADYPEADPEVGGGLLSVVSLLLPRRGIDLGKRVHPLPEDGSVPGLPDWRWIHTPGHTDGHVSLFRESDRALIAGDAFTTLREESVIATLTQEKDIHRPPAYFTTDWDTAWNSVRKIEALHPRFAVTGHGKPMAGEELAQGLSALARDFGDLAIPKHGRYASSR